MVRGGPGTYSNLEQQDGPKKQPFAGVESIQPTIDELKGAEGEKVATRVPSYVIY
jgi:hypothetical protein